MLKKFMLAAAIVVAAFSCSQRIRVATVYADGTIITKAVAKDSIRIVADTAARQYIITRGRRRV